MLELQWPWILLALPLPLIIWLWQRPKSAQRQALHWRFSELFVSGDHSPKKRQYSVSLLLLLLAWCCLIAALTQPTWLGEPTRIPPSGRDLLLALDLSGSMQISDMEVEQQTSDRLSAAKYVLSDFIDKRQGDRIGVIVFGTKAYLQAPLSYDLKTINQLIQETQIGFAGEQTAIGDAIGLGIKRLEDKPADHKILILMTDGANTAGRVSPLQAANFAAKENVTIHTIGIGAEKMVIPGFFGPKEINPSSDLDEPLLTNIAELTGGRFFRARSTEELRAIYHLLDTLEPTTSDEILQRPKTTLFHWLGLAALLLFVAALVATGQLRWTYRGKP